MVRKWDIKITTDPRGNEAVNTIRFGMVEEGVQREITLYITNLEEYRAEGIEITSKADGLSIIAPNALESMETKPLVLSWGVNEKTLSLSDTLNFRARIIKEQ